MKQKNASLRAATIAILVSTLLSLVACDKKDGGSSQVVAPANGIYGCGNCFANPVLALQGLQSFTYSHSANFALDLLVSQSGMNVNWQDPLALGFYSGPVALQGYVDVAYPSFSLCNIAAGRYVISTTQPGLMYAKTVSGVILNMTGPGGQIQAGILNAELTNTLDSIGPRIAMNLQLNVNGYMCGSVQTVQF